MPPAISTTHGDDAQPLRDWKRAGSPLNLTTRDVGSTTVPVSAIAGGISAGVGIVLVVVFLWKWWGWRIKAEHKKLRREKVMRASLRASGHAQQPDDGSSPRASVQSSRSTTKIPQVIIEDTSAVPLDPVKESRMPPPGLGSSPNHHNSNVIQTPPASHPPSKERDSLPSKSLQPHSSSNSTHNLLPAKPPTRNSYAPSRPSPLARSQIRAPSPLQSPFADPVTALKTESTDSFRASSYPYLTTPTASAVDVQNHSDVSNAGPGESGHYGVAM